MKIKVKVIPNAKKQEIIDEDGILKIKVNAPAIDGKANKAVIDALAKRYEKRKSQIKIVKGEKARDKIVEITDS